MSRLLLLTVLAASCSQALADLSPRNTAELGASAAFHIVTGKSSTPDTPTPTPTPSSDVCPECDGAGKVGDGTIMLTCDACGGTGKARANSSEMPKCSPTDEPEPPPQPVSSYDNPVAPQQVYRMPGPRWTFENRGTNPSAPFKASHLLSEHGIDATGMSSEEMSALHDNAHNYGDVSAFGLPSLEVSAGSTSAMGGCPSGNCPTSSSSRTTVRRGLFGRRR